MKKSIVLTAFILIVIMSISFAYSSGITGNFYKAFSKTLSPNEKIEQNITVKKYYNLTVRFRYSLDGSDLSFDDPDGTIIIKDSSSNQIEKITGIKGGKVYLTTDKLQIDSIKFVDISNIEKFQNINNQEMSITFYGTKTYLTILVTKMQGNATLQGYVIDELTSQILDDITVSAFEKNFDPNVTFPVAQSTTEDGKYSLSLQADADGASYDVYVKDYQISS
jgi:hypothetical protein